MMERKKAVLILPTYPIDIRGYKYIISLEKKYDIYLLVDRTLNNTSIFNEIEKKFKEKINVGNRLPLNYPFNYLRNKKIAEEIKRIEPEIVVCRDIFLSGFINRKLKKLKIEYILDFCDNFPEVLKTMFGFKGYLPSLMLEHVEKRAVKLFDKVIFVSSESYNYVLSKHKIKKEKNILENVPFLKNEKIKFDFNIEKNKDLIYLGTMNKKIRDFETVFEGLKLLKDEGKKVYLDIYYFLAQNELKKYYEEYSKKLGVDDLITFYPAVKHEELSKILLNYKIGLVPHTRSGATDYTIPNKIYDYMQIGLPVLASNNPSLENIIKKYKFGETYLGEDKEDFAKKIIKLMSEDKKEYRNNGIIGVKIELNWENQFKNNFK